MEHPASGDDGQGHLRAIPDAAHHRDLAPELAQVACADPGDGPGDLRRVQHGDRDHDREAERELDRLPRGDRDQLDDDDAQSEEQGGPVKLVRRRLDQAPYQPRDDRDRDQDLEPAHDPVDLRRALRPCARAA